MRGSRKREWAKNVGTAKLCSIAFFAGVCDVLLVSPTYFAFGQTITSPSTNVNITGDAPDQPPTVGIRNLQPICPSSSSNTYGGDDDDAQERGCEVRAMLVSAMESDDQLQGKFL